ncbi:MAG: LLM class flavin-dependent oxidoreductase [Acidimicrobiia bacterium]
MIPPHDGKPAVNLSAQRLPEDRIAIELACDLDEAGFGGIAISGFGGVLGYAVSLAHVTKTIPFFTAVHPIYLSHALESARQSRHVRTFAGDRFALGLGVSHVPVLASEGIESTSPLETMRTYVRQVRDAGYGGRILLAGVRSRMIDLAYETADGLVMAHAALSDVARLLGKRPHDRPGLFVVSNVISTAIGANIDDARDAVRRHLAHGSARLPNYRAAWRTAGFVEEVDLIESGVSAGDDDLIARGLSDRLVSECCLACTPGELRERVGRWVDAGVDLPILQLVGEPQAIYEQTAELIRIYR